MGEVLLAEDMVLSRRVAIKFVHPWLLDESFRERFMGEARAMARVSHPNVLQIYAFAEHEGSPYFVMEFVDGRSLADWLDEGPRPMDVDVAIDVLAQTCLGVAAIHAADTVHRDLKPSNILLDGALRPRVADLGLALLRREDGQGGKAEVVGTPDYMAPEIFSDSLDATLSARNAGVCAAAGRVRIAADPSARNAPRLMCIVTPNLNYLSASGLMRSPAGKVACRKPYFAATSIFGWIDCAVSTVA